MTRQIEIDDELRWSCRPPPFSSAAASSLPAAPLAFPRCPLPVCYLGCALDRENSGAGVLLPSLGLLDGQRLPVNRKILHDELRAYHRLRDAWSLGFITYRIDPCLWTNCRQDHIEGTKTHLVVKGYYVDLENWKREVFWGNSINQAHQRMNHVKSFLQSHPSTFI